jgi:hypothetical protein
VTPPEVLAQVEGLGYRLGLRPGGLRLSGGTEPPPEVLGLIQGHRAGLLGLLMMEAERDLFEERAGILEFEGRFTRAEAEHLAGPELFRNCAETRTA